MDFPLRKASAVLPLALLVLSSPARAESGAPKPLRVVTDASGMPRCIERVDLPGAIHVSYAGDRYVKRVRIAELPLEQAIPQGRNCSNWRDWGPALPGGHEVRATETTVWGQPLPESALLAFAQARNGATEVHEKTAAEYLDHHPIAHFTFRLNRALTGRLGVGFVSEIYHEYLERKPRNAAIRSQFLSNLGRLEQGTMRPLSERAAAIRFVMIPGVGGNRVEITETSPANLLEAFGGLPKIFKQIGVRFHVLQSAAMAPIHKNVAAVTPRIREILSLGEDIILLGGSRGLPEMMGALAQLKQQPPVPGSGRILGVVNISGLATGSFLCDTAANTPVIGVMKGVAWLGRLLGIKPLNQFTHDNVQALLDMTSRNIPRYMQAVLPDVPKDLPYLSLVGTQHGNGLARTQEEIRSLQKMIIRPVIQSAGANDGYVEYPGTDIPEAWGLNNQALVFNSTHMIVDGRYNEDWAFTPDERGRMLLAGVFHTLLDLAHVR